jgi:hypothetical protein
MGSGPLRHLESAPLKIVQPTLKPRHGSKLRCFISAPFGCDVESVVRALRTYNIECRRLDTARLGRSLSQTVAGEIRRADFLCGVFPEEHDISSTLFEVGFAMGAGIPVIILAEIAVKLPSDFASLPYGRMALSDSRTVLTAIRGLLRSLQQKKRRVKDQKLRPVLPAEEGQLGPETAGESRPRSKVPGVDKERALERLHQLATSTEPSSGKMFEEFIAQLFREAGLLVAAQPGPADRGVDLAIWLDDVATALANPILV